MNRYSIIFLLSLFLVASSCHEFWGERIRGNGVIKKESRPAGDFNGVEAGGALVVYVKQDAQRSVTIETDENLMQYIEVRQDGDRVSIHTRRNYNLDATGDIRVYVTGPVFNSLHVSGASKIISESQLTPPGDIDIHLSGASHATIDVKTPKVMTQISGASEIKLTGQTKDLSVDCSGASHAWCFELMAENADVDVSGASGADVFASIKLKGDASGASSIRYKGNPEVNTNTSGASNVKKAD